MQRVFRYAPSPTGRIHLGQVKAAFIPFVLSRKYDGKFILRIEDTDEARNKPEAVQMLLEDLLWLGVSYDSGPTDAFTKNEFFQSQRFHIYKEYVDKLLAEGKAYKAYETPEERAEQIKAQRTKGQAPVYMGNHANLTAEEIANFEAEGRKPVIRIKVPKNEIIEFEDKIYGKVKVNTNQIGDIVIQRSNGSPMYNFCVVIDDHLMSVTDVVRGFGHLSNTAKQILIYKILGWEIPTFAHFSDIQNESTPGKLSKRHGAKSISQYRAEGYLPEAIINYVIAISCSFHFANKDDEVISTNKIVEAVSYENLLHTNAKFNTAKLDWFNGQHIRKLSKEDFVSKVINWLEHNAKEMREFDENFDLGMIEMLLKNKEILAKALPLVQERVTKFKDIFEYLNFFFVSPDKTTIDRSPSKHNDEEFEIAREKLVEVFTNLNEPWSHEEWENGIRGLADELGWKHGDLFMVVRLLIAGSPFSPPLFEAMEILGKEECLVRIGK